MNLSRKNLILFIITGIPAFGLRGIPLCSNYCLASDLKLASLRAGGCPYSSDPFVKIAIVLSALFILPLAGIFLFSPAADLKKLPV